VILDVMLAIWGVSLLVIAGLWPYCWLPSFALYSLIAWARCRLTLLRAKKTRCGAVEQRHLSIITFIFSLVPFDRDFVKLRMSVEGDHIAPGHPAVHKKTVLAGWIWSFQVYGAISLLATVISAVMFFSLPLRVFAFSVALTTVLILCAFSGVTSDYSEAWGSRHFGKYVDDGTPTPAQSLSGHKTADDSHESNIS
ncbi:hypothetical protein MUP79_02570, partial [Candidatus Bathyarchaeota archaeon]|nr:hypothetical protein [Candidatus Bathyarchaeota archaeon]